MPRHFFNLKTAHELIRDPEGTELLDEDAARAHACAVARELTANRDGKGVRLWRLNVCNDRSTSLFELLLASFIPAISELPPETRASVEDVCRKTASLKDTIRKVHVTSYQVRGTLARSERAPYLVALNGVRL